jgi:REase_DpnII-MboI
VNSAADFLLCDARASLERQLNALPQTGLATVFAGWVAQAPATDIHVSQAVSAAVHRSGAQQDFQTVATIGYALSAGFVGASAHGTLKQGLERLIGRQAFVDEVPMCSDGIGLLGVALGTRELGDSSLSARVVAWLASFVKRVYEMEGTESWQRALFSAVDHVLGDKLEIPSTTSAEAADVRVALHARGIFPAGMKTEGREDSEAFAVIARTSLEAIPYERAAMRLTALKWIIRAAPVAVPGRMTPDALMRLLERVPAGLRRWTWEEKSPVRSGTPRQWDVDNEYHVQNLLWLLLAPLIPDLDDEQYLTKIGQKNPRADLYIPSMKLFIEVKFVRAGDSFQKIVDEISSDATLYNALGNECRDIIAFIWDDSARSQEHDYLKQGLKRLPGITDVVVISRPSDWK